MGVQALISRGETAGTNAVNEAMMLSPLHMFSSIYVNASNMYLVAFDIRRSF